MRELENVIQRAVIFSRGELILSDHITFSEEMDYLSLDILQRIKQGTTLNVLLHETQSLALRAALRVAEHNSLRAADLLGLDVEAFNNLRGELGI